MATLTQEKARFGQAGVRLPHTTVPQWFAGATAVLMPSNDSVRILKYQGMITQVLLEAAVRTPNRRPVAELGWSRADAWHTRHRLRTFEEDWDAPGMDAYDAL